MDYSNRKWIILNVSDITNEMIEESIQSSVDTLRKTLDGSKAILKYEGRKPSCFYGMDTYTHSQIKEELAKSTWTNNE
tara:strand:+ start:1520 stop:1753 length:234 start_codon:yes stop_codon:yes gene_type:complete